MLKLLEPETSRLLVSSSKNSGSYIYLSATQMHLRLRSNGAHGLEVTPSGVMQAMLAVQLSTLLLGNSICEPLRLTI